MLVLSREVGEKVILLLPDDRRIEVLVVANDRGRTKLGFIAPPDVRINRESVQDKIDARATAAAVLGGGE